LEQEFDKEEQAAFARLKDGSKVTNFQIPLEQIEREEEQRRIIGEIERDKFTGGIKGIRALKRRKE